MILCLEIKSLDANALTKIDEKIEEHIVNTSETIFGRHKREVSRVFNRGTYLLKIVLKINIISEQYIIYKLTNLRSR